MNSLVESVDVFQPRQQVRNHRFAVDGQPEGLDTAEAQRSEAFTPRVRPLPIDQVGLVRSGIGAAGRLKERA